MYRSPLSCMHKSFNVAWQKVSTAQWCSWMWHKVKLKISQDQCQL